MPRCLGNFKGYRSLDDRLCVECNGKCKKLDEQLCRSAGESFFREYLGIEGRRGQRKVNPFYRRSAGGGKLVVEGKSSATGETVSLELEKGSVRELRHLSLITEEGIRHVIPIPEGMTPSRFRQEFDQLGVKKAEEGHIYADETEIPWIESLLDTLKMDEKLGWLEGGAGPITYSNVVIEFRVTERYFRALAKIGFHHFLTQIHRFRGDEECFKAIREFIMTEGELSRCDKFVSYVRKSLIFRDMVPVAWGHAVAAEVDYHRLRSRVQLFLGPEYLPPVFTIQLGRNPSPIDYPETSLNFFEYYPRKERGEFDGEVKTGFAVTNMR